MAKRSLWLRLYSDVARSHKLQTLPDDQFKFLINCWCLAKENDGVLPPESSLAWTLHMSEQHVCEFLGALALAKLLDKTKSGYVPHDWDEHQYTSDDSYSRVKKHRIKKLDVPEESVTVDETFLVTPMKREETKTPVTCNASETERSVSVSESVSESLSESVPILAKPKTRKSSREYFGEDNAEFKSYIAVFWKREDRCFDMASSRWRSAWKKWAKLNADERKLAFAHIVRQEQKQNHIQFPEAHLETRDWAPAPRVSGVLEFDPSMPRSPTRKKSPEELEKERQRAAIRADVDRQELAMLERMERDSARI